MSYNTRHSTLTDDSFESIVKDQLQTSVLVVRIRPDPIGKKDMASHSDLLKVHHLLMEPMYYPLWQPFPRARVYNALFHCIKTAIGSTFEGVLFLNGPAILGSKGAVGR